MPSLPKRCQHIKLNGTQCGSPALRGKRCCFFHDGWYTGRRMAREVFRNPDPSAIEFPLLEDANAVQLALMKVMHLLVTNRLDIKTAGLLLYALQTASSNLRRVNFEPMMESVVFDLETIPDSPLGQTELWLEEECEEEEPEEDEQQAAEADAGSEKEEEEKEETPAAAPCGADTPVRAELDLAPVEPESSFESDIRFLEIRDKLEKCTNCRTP